VLLFVIDLLQAVKLDVDTGTAEFKNACQHHWFQQAGAKLKTLLDLSNPVVNHNRQASVIANLAAMRGVALPIAFYPTTSP
jgi:hypothetical protein